MWGTDPVKSKQECLIFLIIMFAIFNSLAIINHIQLYIAIFIITIYKFR